MKIKTALALVLILCIVCLSASASGKDDEARRGRGKKESNVSPAQTQTVPEPYDVALPYEVIEGCTWSYTETQPGIVRLDEVYTEEVLLRDGWEEAHFQFSGVSEGETELTFSYVNGETGQRENAYLVKLCVSKGLRVIEEDIGLYEISFSSFDGSGTDFECTVSEEGIVHTYSYKKYRDPDHDKMTGSGYEMIFGFSGREEGTVTVSISSYSPIIDDPGSAEFTLTVDKDLHVHRDHGMLTEFSLSRSRMYMAPDYSFSVDEEGNVTLTLTNVPDTRIIPADNTLAEEIASVMLKYDAAEWDGFHEIEEYVLDGEGFSLYAGYEDGTHVYASGSNAFPKGYFGLCSAIDALMEPYVERCRAEYETRAAEGTELEYLSIRMDNGTGKDDFTIEMSVRPDEDTAYLRAVISADEFDVPVHYQKNMRRPASGRWYCFSGDVQYPPLDELAELLGRYGAASYISDEDGKQKSEARMELCARFTTGEEIDLICGDDEFISELFRECAFVMCDYIKYWRDGFVEQG